MVSEGHSGAVQGRGELRSPGLGIVTNSGKALVRTVSRIRIAQFSPSLRPGDTPTRP
ncbi:hypothetical protein GCM10009663_66680 [Kitasatospora arboriphila]|uniref:Uncharacterized protein n=1 Tax=Kitasatospora arboriphila TaxID=258052 RepID=A0ABP4ERI3_9ACTN